MSLCLRLLLCFFFATTLIYGQTPRIQVEEMAWFGPEGRGQSVPAFTKVELGLRLSGAPTEARARYAFDGIRGQLTSPSGRRRQVLIFYYQPFRYGIERPSMAYESYRVSAPDSVVWRTLDAEKPAKGPLPWRMRWVLDEPGTWEFSLMRKTADGWEPLGETVILPCVPSERRGWLDFQPGERYLSDAQGQHLLLMGHNLAYYHNREQPPAYRDTLLDGEPTYARNTRWQYEHYLDELSGNPEGPPGGNFTRILMNPWTFDLELKEAGNYDACQNRAFDLDRVVEMAEERGVYLLLGVIDHSQFNHHPDPQRRSAHYYWAQNPYALSLPQLSEPADFFTDSTAHALVRQKIRYLVARWGYTPHLLGLELMSEMDNFLAANHRYYVQHRAAIDTWASNMGRYAHRLREPLLVTTGTMNHHSAEDFWADAGSDFSSYHIYHAPKNVAYWHSYWGQRLWRRFEQPFLITEFGDQLFGADRTACAVDQADSDPATWGSLHNLLWASAFQGGMGTAMIWHFYLHHAHWLDPKGVAHYPLLRAFLAGEDLHGLQPHSNPCSGQFRPDFEADQFDLWQGCYPDSRRAPFDSAYLPPFIQTTNDDQIAAFCLKGDDRALGWVQNKNHYWYDLPHQAQAGRDPEPCAEFNWPPEAEETPAGLDPNRYPFYRDSLILTFEAPGWYEVEWWNTYPAHDYNQDGEPEHGEMGPLRAWTQQVYSPDGTLTIPIPGLVGLRLSRGLHAPDYGFKVKRRPSGLER